MADKHLGEGRLLVKHAHNGRLVQPHNGGVRHRGDRRNSPRLTSEAPFAEEVIRSKDCDDRFFALLRNDGDLHLALLDKENRVRRLALGKNGPILAVLADASPVANMGEEGLGVE